MNDQDYIRKAVELADGWRINLHSDVDENANPFETEVMWNPSVGSHKLSDPGQTILDALAAQLVRQVDALDADADPEFIRPVLIHIFADSTTINDCRQMPPPHLEYDGPDRTMNTIRAIVDSKVLE